MKTRKIIVKRKSLFIYIFMYYIVKTLKDARILYKQTFI